MSSEDDHIPESIVVVQIYVGSEEKIEQSDGDRKEGDREKDST